MSSELRLKKLRGSGGYVMATVTDEQQMKGNLGGPDLFLAPIGRLDANTITKHFCNTCEKEFEGPPKIEFENPNEEVAENLILAERGQYICNSCNASIAQPAATQPGPATSVTSIEGKSVFDENANKIGTAKQVGIDSTQSMVLVITKEDGTEGSIPWNSIKKIGEVVLLGKPEVATQIGKCSSCGFVNKEGSKFCEECGNKI
jgi:sporulation protein YlmC with PRC-barrel domain